MGQVHVIRCARTSCVFKGIVNYWKTLLVSTFSLILSSRVCRLNAVNLSLWAQWLHRIYFPRSDELIRCFIWALLRPKHHARVLNGFCLIWEDGQVSYVDLCWTFPSQFYTPWYHSLLWRLEYIAFRSRFLSMVVGRVLLVVFSRYYQIRFQIIDLWLFRSSVRGRAISIVKRPTAHWVFLPALFYLCALLAILQQHLKLVDYLAMSNELEKKNGLWSASRVYDWRGSDLPTHFCALVSHFEVWI